MIKASEDQKVHLEENIFATITSEGTLIIEYITEGPLGQDRARCIGLSAVGAQALLDLLANSEAVEHKMHPTPPSALVNHCKPVNGVHAPFCTGHETAGG